MQVQAYLTFNGRCEEAIVFYKKAIGAKVEAMMRFKDAPADHRCSPGTENNIMHSCLRIGDTAVMASDGMAQGKPEFKGFSLTISAKNEAEADRRDDHLRAGTPGGGARTALRRATPRLVRLRAPGAANRRPRRWRW